MSLFHRIKQFVRYRSKALSRHGIHSPFVYDFADKVLRKSAHSNFKDILTDYFSDYRLVWDEWRLIDVREDVIIVLEDIHADKKRTAVWNTLVSDKRVQLSLDLFDYGLLFFKNEFLEKQHFVLRK